MFLINSKKKKRLVFFLFVVILDQILIYPETANVNGGADKLGLNIIVLEVYESTTRTLKLECDAVVLNGKLKFF